MACNELYGGEIGLFSNVSREGEIKPGKWFSVTDFL